MRYLTELDLSRNILDDEKTVVLSGVFQNKQIIDNLETLILAENNIGVEGVSAICEKIKKDNVIKVLNLNCNSIVDSGFISLCKCNF